MKLANADAYKKSKGAALLDKGNFVLCLFTFVGLIMALCLL